jgi:hypothetical protein
MAMTPQTRDALPQPAAGHAARSRHRTVLLRGAAAAACALVAAACGSTAAPGTAASSAPAASASSAAAASAAKISLTVRFSGSATTAPRHYTLRCEPAGGTVRDPAAACAKLLKGTSLFAALPAHTMCPMILADAGHVVVSGTYLGQKVHETVVDGGCDLARWSKLGQIFN